VTAPSRQAPDGDASPSSQAPEAAGPGSGGGAGDESPSGVRARLERLAALGARAAELAHELRNALAVLETSLHLARRLSRADPRDDAQLEVHFARMAEQIHVGQALVRDALVEARDPAIEREAVDLRTLLIDVASSTSAAEAAPAVRIEVEAAAVIVAIDRRQIGQLLSNLVRNAREAIAARGAGLVRLRGEVEGGRLLLAVEDDGPGIDPALASAIFDPFVSGRAGGTGLGLAVCKRIAEAHGGTIAARPREGGGTVFEIVLPLS
jgi:signal transduction histidine kinase